MKRSLKRRANETANPLDYLNPHRGLPHVLLANAMTHKLAMKMQGGELVVYSKTPQIKPLTGIQKQQIEQREAIKFWKALEKQR
jgi:hypothetical protein